MADTRLKYLISALYGANAGKPALVIGGGPSALQDLERVPGWQAMLQISANGHGFKLPGAKPSFIFTKDDTEYLPRPRKSNVRVRPMEPQMRVFDTPLISIQYWADYRCAEWKFQGNSGQHALAAAALMGSMPVIGVGFDCFQGQTYFHSDGPNVSRGHPPDYWQQRFRKFRERFRGPANIRGVSGVLVEMFGKFKPSEDFSCAVIPPIFDFYRRCPTHRVRTTRAYRDPGKTTQVPADYVLPVTAAEARRLCGAGIAMPCA